MIIDFGSATTIRDKIMSATKQTTRQKPRFKTLKAVRSLIFGKQRLSRDLPRYWGRYFYDHEEKLIEIVLGLEDWSREHRRNYGKAARVDDYLLGHVEEIHEALTAIDEGITRLLADDLDDKSLAIVESHIIDFQKMWALDFTEQPPAPLPPICDAETAALIEALNLALATGTL